MLSPCKIIIYLGLIFLFLPNSKSFAINTAATSMEVVESEMTKRDFKKQQRKQRKQLKKALKPQGSGIFANRKFQIGLLSLAVGLGFSLISGLLGGIALLGFIGVSGIVIGILLLVWGTLEFIA